MDHSVRSLIRCEQHARTSTVCMTYHFVCMAFEWRHTMNSIHGLNARPLVTENYTFQTVKRQTVP